MQLSDVTNISFLGQSLPVLLGVLTILLPRKYLSIPLLITACFTSRGQVIMIGPAHFTALRIMILLCLVRLVIRKEVCGIKLNAIDKSIIWYTIVAIITYTILWQTSEAFVNRMGLVYNVAGTYFLFRFLVKDFEDLNRIIRSLAIIIAPLAVAGLIENATGWNMFSIFGGVLEFTRIKAEKVRCTLSFEEAILAGTFGATLVPLFISFLFRRGSERKLALIGVICSTIITVVSHSSGSMMTYILCWGGFMMWPFRKKMRAVRWGIYAALLSLHLVMKGPVWDLIGRLSNIVGGAGFHRVELIDSFIMHFGEWCLVGTKYTAHWGLGGRLVGQPNMVDITSQYILQGVEGGLLTMVLFISIIVYSFRAIGRAIQATEGQSFSTRICLWSLGVALFGHIVSFISVSYYTQVIVFYYMLLAMISACDGIFKKGVDTVKKTNVFTQAVCKSG
jgi:hypothetical protein